MSLIFYGTVKFQDGRAMLEEPFLGVARDVIGWICGPIRENIEDLRFGHKDSTPQQMHEFLQNIAGNHEMEYCTFSEAKEKLNRWKQSVKQE